MGTTGASPLDSNLEYLYNNDAWYSVSLVLIGGMLTVKYHNFSQDYDDRFHAGDFNSIEELKRFRNLFRIASIPVQDNECSMLVPGTTRVCASYSYGEDDIRFHDALVEDVKANKHAFMNGEEKCLCTFMLLWLHGPVAGTLTSTNIECICQIQSNSQIDPTLASFSDIAMIKIQLLSPSSASNLGAFSKSQTCSPHEKSHQSKETNCVSNTADMFEEIISRLMDREHDIDMGGAATSAQQIMLLNNVEKDLPSSSIKEFIYNQIAISTEVYVFPNLSSELYSRAIVVVDCRKNFKKLFEFMHNPNHFVISSTGRPWLIGENISEFKMPSLNTMQDSETKCVGINVGDIGKLKMANVGTEEYRKAQLLRALFLEFEDHQQRLHKRLALEENKI